jgi:hypothetical protein
MMRRGLLSALGWALCWLVLAVMAVTTYVDQRAIDADPVTATGTVVSIEDDVRTRVTGLRGLTVLLPGEVRTEVPLYGWRSGPARRSTVTVEHARGDVKAARFAGDRGGYVASVLFATGWTVLTAVGVYAVRRRATGRRAAPAVAGSAG